MRLKNILFVVSDIEKSKAFYRELFGLEVVTDFGENVIFTEGLVLQERKLWETFLKKEVQMGGNDAELYFEETDMDGFLKKLEQSRFEIEYVNKSEEYELGQRVVRIYDPDKHVIEVGEARRGVMGTVVVGLLLAGVTAFIIRKIVRDKKNGKTCCGGDCGNCRGGCH